MVSVGEEHGEGVSDFVNGRVVGIPEYVLVKDVVSDLVILTDLVIVGDTDLVFN